MIAEDGIFFLLLKELETNIIHNALEYLKIIFLKK